MALIKLNQSGPEENQIVKDFFSFLFLFFLVKAVSALFSFFLACLCD